MPITTNFYIEHLLKYKKGLFSHRRVNILDLYKNGVEAAIYFKIFRDRTLGCSKELVYFLSDSSCLVTIYPWT